jgi:hypothetical protein
MHFLKWFVLLGVLTAALAPGCGPASNTGNGSTVAPSDPEKTGPPTPPAPPPPPGK